MKKTLLFGLIVVVLAGYAFAQEFSTPQISPIGSLLSAPMPDVEENDPPGKDELLKKNETVSLQNEATPPVVKEPAPAAEEPKKEEPAKKEPEVQPPAPEPKKEETTTTLPTPTEETLDKSTLDMLSAQRLILTRVKSPDELLQYLRDTLQAKNYRAAAMAMAFAKTNYTTQTLQQECLGKWNHIVDRVESVYPRGFPQFNNQTDRLFRTVDSEITLQFVKDANDCWQLGPNSIAKTDDFYEDVRIDRPIHGDWISRNVPYWMFHGVLGLSYFQWSSLLAGFLIGLVVYWVVQQTLYLVMRAYMHVMYKDVTRQSRKVWKQIASIFMVYIWFKTFARVVLTPNLYEISKYVFVTYATFMAILIAMRLVDLLTQSLRIRFQSHFSEAHIDNLIVPFFSRSMKTIVFCVGVVSLAQAFRWPIIGVLSGMGIGGIAIAFAAKETVGNFFGSITVLIDRPFEIGDYVLVEGIEGTVQSVGMRSTRIQTFDDSLITIPNNNLTTAVINNLGKRRNRRFKTFLTLQYDTGVDRIEAFCEAIKELILKNAFTKKEGFSVCLYNLNSSSIDVLLNVVFVCPSPETENRERAKLLRNILKLAEAMDVRFAYPTQTLYLDQGNNPDYRTLPEDNPVDIGQTFAHRLLYPQHETAGDETKNDGVRTEGKDATV